MSPSLSVSDGFDESAKSFPEVFVSSVVTRAGKKSLSVTQSDVKKEGKILTETPSVLTISRNDLVKEQREDTSLFDLFDRILSPEVLSDKPSGYYLDGEVLVESGCLIVRTLLETQLFKWWFQRKFVILF